MQFRIWPAILLLIVPALALSMNTTVPAAHSSNLELRERHFSGALKDASQFADVHHVSSQPGCDDVQPPEAIATPHPLSTPEARGQKVKVSFIIGTDGKVHSPLILESAGTAGDFRVLQTVRTWKYRPATCHGIPTETEGKVEFSSR
jgi:TonB family protein